MEINICRICSEQ
ncbi:hypothetical protein MXB_2283 [Myxobolus squamalis]|nr:hypothetical protein MXB_2283 [Myxobolus squamalis]